MAELTQLGAWIEGEAEAQELVFKLAEAITTAKIPDHKITGEKYPNRWSKIFASEGDMWVTYTKHENQTNAVYKHTDGNSYKVLKINRPAKQALPTTSDDEYQFIKIESNNAVATGELFKFGDITYTDVLGDEVTEPLEGTLCVFIPNDDGAVIGYKVEQIRTTSTGGIEKNSQWDEFKIVATLEPHWSRYFNGSEIMIPINYSTNTWGDKSVADVSVAKQYTYKLLSYTADTTHVSQPCAVLRAVPSNKTGVSTEPMFILLEQPSADYNHITIRYGKGCIALPSTGNPLLTYADACDPLTVRFNNTPTVISQTKAHEIYEDWNNSSKPAFTPYSITWGIDYDGVTELVSPLSRFYHGRHSTVSWVVNKKRRPDYLVEYYISVTNDRVVIILEGDPSPGINDYYRSFAYIGKIIPFNENDHAGNFGVTCGMGDLKADMTDYTINDISEKYNPEYAKWGEYTSNGMYSFSMFDTRSKVKYQAYYPAFLTQLPNYSDVGTIPSHLSKLILDNDGFQPSIWTDKYHASPVYLVHQAEGYRGYMDGVVAIHDHNLINLDELLVDTEIPKDESDTSQGNYTEVYKFFSLKSPVNMFKYSPAPDVITVAILKDIE